jgi:RNA polymerase sigma-70 factor, ECF subfamily
MERGRAPVQPRKESVTGTSQICPAVLERCKRGDVAALGTIYETHGDQVWRVARNVLGSDAEADDATQEVFLRVFERLPSFDGRALFSTWLHRLSVRWCLNRLASQRTHLRSAEPLQDVDPDALADAATTRAFDDVAARDETEFYLGRLDPQARAILVLRELEGLDYAEIADVLEIPLGTVMSRLSRARAKLGAVDARRDARHKEQGAKP